MASEAAQGARNLQVQVRFETKLPEPYRVPGTTFAVPASLNRYGLSEVVNTLLGTSGKSCLHHETLRRSAHMTSRLHSSLLGSSETPLVSSRPVCAGPCCNGSNAACWSLQSDPSPSTSSSRESCYGRLFTSAFWLMASLRWVLDATAEARQSLKPQP